MTKESVRGSVRWIHEEKVDDTVTFRAGRLGTDMVADWPGFARLRCARDGSAATLAPAAGVSPVEIAKLRNGQVRALLRDLSGDLALHGSAVALGGRAVVFIGQDGAGKSTAAAEMCLTHGAQIFADDAVSLEVSARGIRVLPAERDHWLTRESCLALGIAIRAGEATDDKTALPASNVAREPCSLALVVALHFDPSVTRAVLRPLRGVDAARMLLEAAIRFDVDDASARKRELEQITSIYHHAAFFDLVRPSRNPGCVASLVIRALEGGEP